MVGKITEVKVSQGLTPYPGGPRRTQRIQDTPVFSQRIINIPDGIVLKCRQAVMVGVPAHITAEFLVGTAPEPAPALAAGSGIVHCVSKVLWSKPA